MTAPDDDDALRWDDGTDDATHVDGRRPTSIASSATVGDPSFDDGAADIGPATGSAQLVVYGVLAGAYLLFAVGWTLSVLRDTYSIPNLLAEIMYQLGQFLAIVAPLLWFGTVLLLARNRSPFVTVVWLVLGAVVLAPWPFILSGGAA